MYFRRNRKKQIVTEEIGNVQIADDSDIDSNYIETELKLIVHESIRKLGNECQYILKQFYFDEKDMQEIANDLDKTYDSIRKAASRCRSKLKNLMSMNFYNQYSQHFDL